MSTPSLKLQQLYILRAQVDLLISMELGEVEQQPVGCPHPEDKRRQAHNMGEEPKFLCLACGETVPGVV